MLPSEPKGQRAPWESNRTERPSTSQKTFAAASRWNIALQPGVVCMPERTPLPRTYSGFLSHCSLSHSYQEKIGLLALILTHHKSTCPSLERQQHRLRHFLRTPPQPTHPSALPQCRHLLSPGEGWWDRRGEPGLTLTEDRQARLPGVSGSGLTVSPVVHLLGAVRNWKAPQFGRTGREPIGRVLGDG